MAIEIFIKNSLLLDKSQYIWSTGQSSSSFVENDLRRGKNRKGGVQFKPYFVGFLLINSPPDLLIVACVSLGMLQWKKRQHKNTMETYGR